MKRLLILVMSFVTVAAAFAKQITLDDVVGGYYREKGVYGVVPLADGESYSQISEDGKQILRRSFKNGEVLETLFDAKTARNAKLDRVESYIMSPDQKNILIETNRRGIYRHSAVSTYYIYNVHNRTLTPLSTKGEQEVPKFSPDGTMIAFVRDNNIFLVKLLYNNAETQVTKDGEFNKVINGKPDWVYEEEFAFNCAYDFSSDSQMLAWIRFDESEVSTFSFQWFAGAAPAKKEYTLYPGLYSYKYPKAGDKNSKVSVHSYDIKSRVTRNLDVPVESDGYIPRIQFTGVKDKLAVVTFNRHQDVMDIYLVDARATTSQLILREKAEKYVSEDVIQNLDFSRDQFVFLSERDGYQHLYLYDMNGRLVRQLTSGKFVVSEYYGCDASGKNFYYASNEGSPLEKYIYKVDASGKRTKLSTQKGCNTAIFSKGCNYFMNVHSALGVPSVYALCNSSGKSLKVLEDNSELKGKLAEAELGQAELFTFTTADGVELNGWMVKPRNFDASKKYPVLMFQYSGPGNQQVHNSFKNGFVGGLMWEHRLAQKGYIVVCVDGRGTGGRGAEFQKCTYLRMGDLESHDQVETAIWLGQQSYVDKNRIAIWGWSFGGFNTIMSLCEGRKVFKCGVAVAPVTDWRYYDTVYTERFMRTPQENPDGYDCSPMHKYKKLQGDLLIIHGLADDNVHFQNTAELTEAMTQANIQFEMATYTNRNHSIYGGNTRKHLVTRIENYLDRELKK